MQFPIDPEKIVALDWETYFDSQYSLRSKEYSTSSYIRDPQFHAHCVGMKIGSGETKVYWEDEIAPALAAIDWTTHAQLSHHTQFDGLILSHHYGIVPAFYLDTMSMAKALHSNQTRAGLDAVGQYYGVGNKLKNVLGKMKGHRVIPAELRDEATAYTKQDVDLMVVVYRAMALVFPERELRLIDLTCRMFCDPQLEIDPVPAQEELDAEIAEKAEKVALCGFDVDELMSAGKLANVLRGLGVEPPMKESPRTGLQTFAFSLQDEEFIGLGAHPDERVRAVIEARIAVKSTGGETRARRFLKAGENGQKFPIYIGYCAAHTTRWGGGDKTNVQNLKRGGRLRKAIKAPKGFRIAKADSAQIEARVLAWLARQLDLLKAFADGADIYSRFATDVYGHEVNRKRRDPDGTYPDFNKGHVGKVCILGLGFGMGHAKLRGTLALGALGGPPVFIEEDESRSIVNLYRGKYRFIKQLWRELDDVLFRMFMKRVNNDYDSYGVIREGVLEYDAGSIWLPNGLPLHYPELKGEFNEEYERFENFTYKTGKEYSKIYGGLLTENVVQALARVIVADQMLDISERWRVVMMAHDEVICLVPEDQADACLADMLQVMKTPPLWGPDIPLFAEGSHGADYAAK